MKIIKSKYNWRSVVCGLAVFLLIGCDDAPTVDNSAIWDVRLAIENPLGQATPSSALARNFNPDSNPPSVTINGNPASLISLGGGLYEVTGMYPSNITVDVVWSQLFEDAVLELATVSKSFTLQDGGSYSIDTADYITNFDTDRDLDTNLFELKDEQGLGLNPRNSNICTRCRSDVASHIRRISPTDAPVIDGSYDNIWNRSQFKDINGDAWLTNSAGAEDFRFASMHDDQNLYLFLLRDRGTGAPGSDDRFSVFFSNIDQNQTINVLNVPESALVGDPEDFVYQNGFLVDSSTDIDATVASNSNVQVWEARVDLNSLGLLSDRFFMQVTVNNGGESDSLHTWAGVVFLNQ